MTKEEYLAALEIALQPIRQKRRVRILEDYAQRIDRMIAAGYAPQAAVAAQGDSAEVAAAILSAQTRKKGRGGKIALWVLFGLVVTGVLGAGVVLTARLTLRNLPSTVYVNLPGGARAEHTIPAKDIQNVCVEWTGGAIRVEPSPDEKTHLIETGAFDAQNRQLDYDLTDGILYVAFGGANYEHKDLVVQLPTAQLETLHLNTNAGDVSVLDIAARGVKLVSGAGDVEFSGGAEAIVIQTGAGDIAVNVPKDATTVALDTGAGDIALTLPKNLEFRMEAKTGVGSVDVSIPGAIETASSVWQTGGGACEITAESGVGDIRVTEE